MIVGIFLRYIKTYQGINYIPITDEDGFCGLVGDNGIGKSSVLEALDCFFNSKAWNYNIATRRRGLADAKPQIVPVFLIERNKLEGEPAQLAQHLSDVAVAAEATDVALSYRADMQIFIQHRNALRMHINLDNYYLLPLGIDYSNAISVSFLNCRLLVDRILEGVPEEGKTTLDASELDRFKPLLDKVKSIFEYIYIPKDIDTAAFTKLETDEIQALMGESLNEILEARVPASQITEINRSLNEFIETLSTELDGYSYRTPTDRQQNLKKNDVYNLITQAFFNIRRLHKRQGDNWLEISNLSSGEKQKAIIDVARSLIIRHRTGAEHLIIGIDEPEASLHMSACFDQFDSIYQISRSCRQLIFSSHWYGFFPTSETGSASIISKNQDGHIVDSVNLGRYREQVRQMVTGTQGVMPYDIRLKSINDLVQSIMASVIGDQPFNWLICEGSSEKKYFAAYFSDLISSHRLRIVPVGGAKEIKKIYNHLATAYEDFRNEISGKIILVSDTDANLVRYETEAFERLICKRIVSCQTDQTTKLVGINANPSAPETEIEDALNGGLFLDTLRTFQGEYADLAFLNDVTCHNPDAVCSFALDLLGSQRLIIKSFFDHGNNKYEFSRRYAEALTPQHAIPPWINQIRDAFTRQ
ncbi:MAG: AAA family ATPase [bacterium]|nr:AAA family ATPase [bacterium]